jgi:type I restriction-modification system DNA methylase subunit
MPARDSEGQGSSIAIPEKVLELIERFDRNLDAYKQSIYNETQLRREFIDPFFKSLGWDVDNEQGYAEPYKDVVHEDAIKIGGFTKAPDYSFRIGGARKFFVEAKKPAINIKEDLASAYQLRRYAWSAKLPLSILTNFEDLAVYDCRMKPEKTDKASHSRVFLLKYTDYQDRWEEIAGIFSQNAILKGSFDKYAESKKAKKGTAEVDTAFLQEIERWREILAKNIALRNPSLTQRELNYAVQVTIDRIIFLRIGEDRGIEPYGVLMALQNGNQIYQRLFHLFSRADDRYNSGLFHFREEKGLSSAIDTLTPTLAIDDKILKDIFKNLYYPDSPYEFSVLPADILGQVYEQFLGKVIRLTAGHQAKVEYKPEVRKAGGVYYTPTYIVDYIVSRTVGRWLEGKKAGTRSGLSRLTILDPACGSGSFLLGAYQYLLNWHLTAYLQNGTARWARGRNPRIYQATGGDWKLTIAERKRILLDHIFGVDIDSQAVEVTKLSLLLKVLEGENDQSVKGQLSLNQRALPDLGANIKCGNSLIGPDFYHGRQLGLLEDEETYRVNAFDWQAEFPEIMAAGGFDVVMGNPPYLRIQILKEWAPLEMEFYKRQYQAAAKGNYDIYVIFVEKGLGLLKPQGRLGFILPHKFFNAHYGEGLRSLIAAGNYLEKVVHFGDQQVFAGATTYTCLLFLERAALPECEFVKVDNLSDWRITGEARAGAIPAKSITAGEWNFAVGNDSRLFEKLSKIPVKILDIADRIFQGLITGSDSVFILLDYGNGEYFSEATQKIHHLESKLMHPVCKGAVNIRRYHISQLTKSILFPYNHVNGVAQLLTSKELNDNFPNTWEYLQSNRKILESREHDKWKNDKWYSFGRSQNLSEMEQKKILTPSIAKYASFTLDSQNFYYFVGSGGGGGGGYGITLKSNQQIEYEYILGLLNSRLLYFFLKSFSSKFSGGYYAFNRQYIEKLPIRLTDFTDPLDKARHDRLVAMVENMLVWHKQLAATRTPQEKAVLERQIAATDGMIDQLVYELYGLTEAEIKLVEGA